LAQRLADRNCRQASTHKGWKIEVLDRQAGWKIDRQAGAKAGRCQIESLPWQAGMMKADEWPKI